MKFLNHGLTRTALTNVRTDKEISETAERKRGVSVLVCGFIIHGQHRLAVLTLACLAILRCAFAATWYVDAAKGNDESTGTSWDESLATIQSAVDKATSGDEILVNDGTYSPFKLSRGSYQSVVWLKVAIRSMNGPHKTIVDGGQVRLGDGYYNTTLTGASIEGFTIRGGNFAVDGPGVVKRCILTDVHGEYTVDYCYVYSSIFYGNAVSGTEILGAKLYNCTIYANHGKYIAYDSLGGALYNCIHCGDNRGVFDGSGGYAWRNGEYNCFSGDPKFVNINSGDFRLLPISPCIDNGNNSYASSDDKDIAGKPRINGGTVDIGAYEYYQAECALSNVKCRQRYPWNGKVDIDFSMSGEANVQYITSLSAKDLAGNTNLPMRTVCKLDGSAVNVSGELVSPGTHHWVWNAAADLPNGFECDRVTVEVKASDPEPLYMVIDLSSGPDSTSYPVSYLDAVPSGGWSDEYKTTKLVLRRIEPGTFKMCGQYDVTITKPFYIGVFEVTQKQYLLVKGSNPSDLGGDKRPVEMISYNAIRGSTNGAKWPSSIAVDSASFMGRIRARTGLDFDLPTDAQWEYACRAGTTSSYNNGGSNETDLQALGRYTGNQSDGHGGCSQHTVVGSYQPNAWGLYDMHGNVWEWVLDWYGNISGGTDPKGASSGTRRVIRGGGWHNDASFCTSSRRYSIESPGSFFSDDGFRICLTLAE